MLSVIRPTSAISSRPRAAALPMVQRVRASRDRGAGRSGPAEGGTGCGPKGCSGGAAGGAGARATVAGTGRDVAGGAARWLAAWGGRACEGGGTTGAAGGKVRSRPAAGGMGGMRGAGVEASLPSWAPASSAASPRDSGGRTAVPCDAAKFRVSSSSSGRGGRHCKLSGKRGSAREVVGVMAQVPGLSNGRISDDHVHTRSSGGGVVPTAAAPPPPGTAAGVGGPPEAVSAPDDSARSRAADGLPVSEPVADACGASMAGPRGGIIIGPVAGAGAPRAAWGEEAGPSSGSDTLGGDVSTDGAGSAGCRPP